MDQVVQEGCGDNAFNVGRYAVDGIASSTQVGKLDADGGEVVEDAFQDACFRRGELHYFREKDTL